MFCLQDFCRTWTTLNMHNRHPVNRRRRSLVTSWPLAWPLNSPGMLFIVAGPPFQGWTPTPWPFPGGRPCSSKPCPLPSCRGYRTSMSAPDVARCSGKALTLAVSSPCSRRSYTSQTRTRILLKCRLQQHSRTDWYRAPTYYQTPKKHPEWYT